MTSPKALRLLLIDCASCHMHRRINQCVVLFIVPLVVQQKLLFLQLVLTQPGQPNSTTERSCDHCSSWINMVTFPLMTAPVVRLVLSITMPMMRCDLELSVFISEEYKNVHMM